MYHNQTNPFIQHAVRHGMMIVGEVNRTVGVSRNLIAACDEVIMSLNAGNMQGAFNAAQNARNLAAEIAQATGQMNQTISERIEMASYVLNRVQQHINELASALQSMRNSELTYSYTVGVSPNPQYGTTMSYRETGTYM
ncbi:hypothetical protein [Desulfoscipio geothermicus]|uniref:Uncharacterized protein n=1 Tax=Desulfoscipio geothermicus DSM 3669 TaxID=1121426 RepID=A0A1I6D583_9FIRM|nr:hypothetical protein [Desulfoscipio geothermicus]SFR00521.1 hypothetical protein SAMN05660706_105125 [Desulfoscipio geothermicus DSM 3669]